MCMCAKSLQFCPTLCDTMNCSPPGYWVHGILQARILEWVAVSFSRGPSQPRDWTWVSCVPCTGWRILYHRITREAQGFLRRLKTSLFRQGVHSNLAGHKITSLKIAVFWPGPSRSASHCICHWSLWWQSHWRSFKNHCFSPVWEVLPFHLLYKFLYSVLRCGWLSPLLIEIVHIPQVWETLGQEFFKFASFILIVFSSLGPKH